MSELSSVKVADFTARKPVPQGSDKRLTVTFGGNHPIAAGDAFRMQLREEITGDVVGELTSDEGDFTLDVEKRELTIHLWGTKNLEWFSKAKLTAATVVRTLTGTLIHTDGQGAGKPWSGHIGIKLRFEIGFTRD